MPLVRIVTNVPIDHPSSVRLCGEATAIAARELGKPESITMAILEQGTAMTFGGAPDPSALFEIEGIELSSEPADALCQALSGLAETELDVPAERVFVKLSNVPRGYWAGNRKVF